MRASFILAILAYAGMLAGPVYADDLADRSWSITAAPSLESHPPSPQEVQDLINKALDSDWTVKPCSYAFANLGHDGAYELIASLDVNGRHFCNRLIVIGKNRSDISILNDFKVVDVEDVHGILQTNTEHRVAVLPQSWGLYDGGACSAVWIGVYEWQGNRFAENGRSFPDIYQARLKRLEVEIPDLKDATCAEMERDRIKRFLGIDPVAGYAEAIAWMRSPNASLRRKAAAVFVDIGDANSQHNLDTLAHDSEPLVAEAVKGYRDAARRP